MHLRLSITNPNVGMGKAPALRRIVADDTSFVVYPCRPSLTSSSGATTFWAKLGRRRLKPAPTGQEVCPEVLDVGPNELWFVVRAFARATVSTGLKPALRTRGPLIQH